MQPNIMTATENAYRIEQGVHVSQAPIAGSWQKAKCNSKDWRAQGAPQAAYLAEDVLLHEPRIQLQHLPVAAAGGFHHHHISNG